MNALLMTYCKGTIMQMQPSPVRSCWRLQGWGWSAWWVPPRASCSTESCACSAFFTTDEEAEACRSKGSWPHNKVHIQIQTGFEPERYYSNHVFRALVFLFPTRHILASQSQNFPKEPKEIRASLDVRNKRVPQYTLVTNRSLQIPQEWMELNSERVLIWGGVWLTAA